MRLGIDFDNTLADFGGLLRAITLERTGVDFRAIRAANPDVADIEALCYAAVGRERFDALSAEIVLADHSTRIESRPGAIEVMRRLGARHEIVLLTARSEAESVTPRRWLEHHGLRVAGFVTTATGPKATHAIEHSLAAHLDDSVAVFEAFDDAHPTVPVLMAHPMNAAHPRAAHWRSVEDWLAFERLVETLERER